MNGFHDQNHNQIYFYFLFFGGEELDLEMDPWLHLCLEREELRQF
jgi:hypothetical protein